MFKTLHFEAPHAINCDAVNLVNHPEISLVIWKRALQVEIIRFLQSYALEGGAEIAFEASSETFSEQLFQALLQAGATRDPDWAYLHADVEQLAQLFFALTETPLLRLDLSIITGPHCTRFHADYNLSRLLCTYLGPGTEWTPHKNVRWCQDHDQALPCVEGLKDPDRVRQLENFDIAWLKGRRHMHSQGYGQVHRSPDLPEGTPFRILLRLDQV
jgi:hypothetical protein